MADGRAHSPCPRPDPSSNQGTPNIPRKPSMTRHAPLAAALALAVLSAAPGAPALSAQAKTGPDTSIVKKAPKPERQRTGRDRPSAQGAPSVPNGPGVPNAADSARARA